MGIGESSLRQENAKKSTDFFTLILYHGGAFVGKPSLMYVGGRSVMYDFLNLKRDITMENLKQCVEKLELPAKRRIFGITKEGLKPLYNTGDLLSLAKECESSRLLEVCVEVNEVDGAAVENDVAADVVENDGRGDVVENEDVDEYETEVEDEDVVCDWDDDFDETRDSDEESAQKKFSRFNKDVVYTPNFELGMEFESRDLFKKAITSHAINTKRSLYFKKIDNIRVHARCREEGCKWMCNALKVMGQATFQIRTYNQTHTCAPTFHVTNMSSTWLGQRHLSEFQCDPKRDVRGWRKEVIQKLNVNVSKQQAYRARAKALSIIHGEPDLQYNKLWDYAQELRSSNPGTTVVLDVDGEGKFSKFYVCFDACKRGFSCCRPFIGVDGCWLKGPRGGILLSAVGVDPGNAIFPIAFVVVSVENRETWEWFLVLLKNDLGIFNSEKYTFMSDKQKGLIIALREVFPDAESRFCVRHMINNLQSAGFRGLEFSNAVYTAARASTLGTFNECMRHLRNYNEAAAEWLCDKNPNQWSKSHFKVHSKCDMTLNNVCESFNAAILDARDKPIITMFEWLRQWLMERFQVNRDKAARWRGKLTPNIVILLRKTMEKMNDCIPIKSSDRHYQIQCPNGSQYVVDLVKRTCSCRIWELSGIPCKHALSAIANQGEDPEYFVHECYSLDTYRRVYDPAILPISGQVEWAQTLYIPPLPPNFGKKRGRPKKLRRKDLNDSKENGKKKQIKMKRQKGISKCKKCGEAGHTMRKCKKAQTEATNEVTQPTEATNEVPQPTTDQTEDSTVQPTKKLKVRRPTEGASEVAEQATNMGGRGRGRVGRGRGRGGRGRGRSQDIVFGCGINMGGRSLVDEDNTTFDALLSQANSGRDAVPILPGPSPWEQLMLSTSTHPQPTHSTTTTNVGGLEARFSSQTRDEASKKKIFITAKGKTQFNYYN